MKSIANYANHKFENVLKIVFVAWHNKGYHNMAISEGNYTSFLKFYLFIYFWGVNIEIMKRIINFLFKKS
jgi:hypothetical protein